MKKYEYGHIDRLAAALATAHIAPEIAGQILEGGEAIRRTSSGEDRAAWMCQAMQRMDRLLDEGTVHAVREDCACCLGGQRLALSKGIARRYATLEERVSAANETHMVFGNSVKMQQDGSIVVRFCPEQQKEFHCVCLRKAQEPLPISYCYCCGGHIKHHLQIALGRQLALTVRSSALSSGGTKDCIFSFRLADQPAS